MAKGKAATGFIGLRISPDHKAALERLAAGDRRSLSDYIRILLEDQVKAKTSKR
jgi:hypothetical protein